MKAEQFEAEEPQPGRGAPRLSLPVGERDHALGPARAPITLVLYGDYESPFSAQAYRVIWEQRQRLGERLRYVFRNFPVAHTHPNAQQAAEAAEAAAVQGKFWEMHHALFTRPNVLSGWALTRLALELDLSLPRFARDMSSHVHQERIRLDVLSGRESGVRETPTVFLNGEQLGSPTDPRTLYPTLIEVERLLLGGEPWPDKRSG
jgi:protein-disulfide isomerase